VIISSPSAEVPWRVFDGHVDLVYALQRQGQERAFAEVSEGSLNLRSFAVGGVRLLSSALYCADVHNGPLTAATYLQALLNAEGRLLASLPLLRTASELEATWAGGGKPGRLRLLENADALLEFGVAAACAAGIVTIGLTHACRNRLADGNAVTSPHGLTVAGRQLLVELAAAGRVLDVAHLAAAGFREVLAGYPGSLCCSHTGLRRFCDRPRNLADDQLAALFGRGGVVGLALAPELLTADGVADLDGVFRQLDWLVQRFGWEQIGLGSDFGGFDGTCAGLEEPARLPALALRLQRAGYPVAAIAGIMGENWRRFYAAVLPPADGFELSAQ
jgi:membrane dipeptidase